MMIRNLDTVNLSSGIESSVERGIYTKNAILMRIC